MLMVVLCPWDTPSGEMQQLGKTCVRPLRLCCELSLLPRQDVWGQNRGSHGAQLEVGPVRTGGHLQRRRWSFVYCDPEAVGGRSQGSESTCVTTLAHPSTSFYCKRRKRDNFNAEAFPKQQE